MKISAGMANSYPSELLRRFELLKITGCRYSLARFETTFTVFMFGKITITNRQKQ